MIDSHAHVASDDPAKYPPAPPSGQLKPGELDDPLTVERLLAEMDKAGVEKAVLVQRGSIYGFDNRYVCDGASRHPDRLAAVCSIDAASDDGKAAVHRWVGEQGAVGIRLMQLIRESDMSWLDSPSALEVWRTADAMGATVCVHFFPWNRAPGLTALRRILEELPGLNIVIDHLSNTNVVAGAPDHGVDDLLTAVAAFPGVRTKFTTIPLGRLDEQGIDFGPILDRVVQTFGPERVMWGSDITQSQGTYDYMVRLGRRAVAGQDADRQADILANAVSGAYRGAWARR